MRLECGLVTDAACKFNLPRRGILAYIFCPRDGTRAAGVGETTRSAKDRIRTTDCSACRLERARIGSEDLIAVSARDYDVIGSKSV